MHGKIKSIGMEIRESKERADVSAGKCITDIAASVYADVNVARV